MQSLTREQSLESVGAGWAKIINSLWDLIDAAPPGTYTVKQVKEKFGGLRFYFSGPEEATDLDIAVQLAGVESCSTCEFCGEPGKTRNISRYWIKTFCDACGERQGAPIGVD